MFEDRPDFTPNLTPAQVIRAGTWGGSPSPARRETGRSGPCDIDEGRFRTKWFGTLAAASIAIEGRARRICTASRLDRRNSIGRKGWIDARDQEGWFQWYCRFYLVPRGPGPEKTTGRFQVEGRVRRKGRWKRNLINKIIE